MQSELRQRGINAGQVMRIMALDVVSIPERCLPLIDSNLAHNMRSLSRPAAGRRAASLEHA
jgi:hypothetical protein